MQGDSEFEGGVFSEAIEGGRAGARLSLGHDALQAVTAEGARFRLPYAGCQVELGGASGKMWFCRTPDRNLTLFCEAAGFADALRERARRELGPALERLEQDARAHGRRTAAIWLAVLGAVALALTGAMYGLRQAGRAAIDVLPTSVDEQLGELASERVGLEGQPIDDPVVKGAVTAIVERLKRAHKSAFNYRVRVVDAPILNAFALPGGFIVVYTGLVRAAERPEQLAGVLAHEMAHVERRHGMHRIAQSVGVVAAIQLLFGDVTGLAAVAVEVLRAGAINSYGRDQEREADRDALGTLARARLDPGALADFFALLQRKEPSLPSAIAWLGTHPELAERIQETRRQAERLRPPQLEPFALDWPKVQKHAGRASED